MSRNLLLIIPLILFLSSAGPTIASAEDETPDFSVFENPNITSRPSRSQSKTEAEPPCITCGQEHPKTKNQKALEAITKKTKSVDSCITCDRVLLSKNKTKKKATKENAWDQYPQIAGYSNSAAVNAMIKYAERHAFRHSRGICYRNVKDALCRAPRGSRCKGPLVSKYMNGTPVFPELPSRQRTRIGKNAILNMKSEGFINLLDKPEFIEIIKNPASAPKGAIMVYQGGKNGGHIEIKTGYGTTGSYVSDFSAPDSIMRNKLAGRASAHYKLVGVMIKPAENI